MRIADLPTFWSPITTRRSRSPSWRTCQTEEAVDCSSGLRHPDSQYGASQVPRPSCVEGRENEGSKTAEFFFIGRLWKNFSWKVGKDAHNWNRQHVNSNFFSDDPSISQLGAAVEPLFSLRPIFHFPSANFPLPCSAFFNWISLQIIFHICFPLSNCMC